MYMYATRWSNKTKHASMQAYRELQPSIPKASIGSGPGSASHNSYWIEIWSRRVGVNPGEW